MTMTRAQKLLGATDEGNPFRQVKKVVRGGKIKKKVFCRPGYKAVKGRCVKMAPQETRKRTRANILSGRKRASRSHARANIKAKRSNRLRKGFAKRK